jgi:hypothetical protein
MDNHKADLGALVKKYDQAISELEMQIAEAKRKKSLVVQTIDLWEREGIFEEQDKLFEVQPSSTPIRISDKYADSSMPKAIYDVLKNNDEGLGTERIILELQRHGFKSGSQNLKRDVYTRLYRLEKDKKLFSVKEGGLKKYKLPKAKEGDIEQKE